jgi:hypothetical protein
VLYWSCSGGGKEREETLLWHGNATLVAITGWDEEFCSFFLPEVLSCDQMLTSCYYFIMQIGAEVSFRFIHQCDISWTIRIFSTEPASFEEFDWSASHSGLSRFFLLWQSLFSSGCMHKLDWSFLLINFDLIVDLQDCICISAGSLLAMSESDLLNEVMIGASGHQIV